MRFDSVAEFSDIAAWGSPGLAGKKKRVVNVADPAAKAAQKAAAKAQKAAAKSAAQSAKQAAKLATVEAKNSTALAKVANAAAIKNAQTQAKIQRAQAQQNAQHAAKLAQAEARRAIQERELAFKAEVARAGVIRPDAVAPGLDPFAAPTIADALPLTDSGGLWLDAPAAYPYAATTSDPFSLYPPTPAAYPYAPIQYAQAAAPIQYAQAAAPMPAIPYALLSPDFDAFPVDPSEALDFDERESGALSLTVNGDPAGDDFGAYAFGDDGDYGADYYGDPFDSYGFAGFSLSKILKPIKKVGSGILKSIAPGIPVVGGIASSVINQIDADKAAKKAQKAAQKAAAQQAAPAGVAASTASPLSHPLALPILAGVAVLLLARK